ncbi:sulfite exporter TauE/SafE family protein [Pannonibacter phragmitetus]|uniref:sulfite exporter TauE/SafE family protein n=1 Tax=Pannonibacter phragmitetus TaxID=121719 RepID=UPI000F447448|nr:sulfite exporter TauE/SafE family protein [Pannonibacter phragmitetus]
MFLSPISDPLFYAVAIPAVILAGLGKGGFGGPIGMLAVPLMALVIPPIQAAGIMLPVLIVMDGVSLAAYRGTFDRKAIAILLPAGILGVGLGWLTAAFVENAHVTLLVGVISLAFVADRFRPGRRGGGALPHNLLSGIFWGTVSGFTSFVSHTGGPPYQIYMVPRGLAPALFAGTAVIFFTTVNVVKLVPYFLLGQFDAANLATAAVLLPLAPLATLAGWRLTRIVRPQLFYGVVYAVMAVVSTKLVWDGLSALTGAG